MFLMPMNLRAHPAYCTCADIMLSCVYALNAGEGGGVLGIDSIHMCVMHVHMLYRDLKNCLWQAVERQCVCGYQTNRLVCFAYFMRDIWRSLGICLPRNLSHPRAGQQSGSKAVRQLGSQAVRQ